MASILFRYCHSTLPRTLFYIIIKYNSTLLIVELIDNLLIFVLKFDIIYNMKDLSIIVAQNIVSLRQKNNLTQSELGEKLNYSDKSVSKWERGEATPSIEVLKDIANIFNVSIDFLTNEHLNDEYDKKYNLKENKTNKISITLLAASVVWLTATVLFVYFTLIKLHAPWLVFVVAVPISCIILLIFNCIWGKRKFTYFILSALIWTLLSSIFLICLAFKQYDVWLIFIIGVPLQTSVILWSKLKTSKKPH